MPSAPPGPISTPHVSSAPTSISSFDAGLPGSLIENLYLPGARSSIGPSGPFMPTPAAALIVCLLIVITASAAFDVADQQFGLPRFRHDAGLCRGVGISDGEVHGGLAILAAELEQRRAFGGGECEHHVVRRDDGALRFLFPVELAEFAAIEAEHVARSSGTLALSSRRNGVLVPSVMV